MGGLRPWSPTTPSYELPSESQEWSQPGVEKTTLIFISDLIDDTPLSALCAQASKIKQSGAQLLFLLALSDHGVPFFSKEAAQALAQLEIPALYCTPERFPKLIRNTLNQQHRSR